MAAYRAGEPFGDVVLMKLDAYPQPRADVLRRLEAVCGYAPSVGQGSAPIGRGLLAVGTVLYGLVSPTQGRRIWHNVRLGLTLGQHAELVIAQPVESWFEEPLATVRARLGIPDPRAAGVLDSGHSVIGDLVYPRAKPA